MARTLNSSTHKLSVTGDTSFSSISNQIIGTDVTITDAFIQQGTIAAGGTDTYSAASFVNLSTTITYLLIKHYGDNTLTVTITHGGANTPDVFTLQAEGKIELAGALQGTLTSIALAGTAGEKYLLAIAD